MLSSKNINKISWSCKKYYYVYFSNLQQHLTASNAVNKTKIWSHKLKSLDSSQSKSYLKDKRILFSSLIEKEKLPDNFKQRKYLINVREEIENEDKRKTLKPLAYEKFMSTQKESVIEDLNEDLETSHNFPYSHHSDVINEDNITEKNNENQEEFKADIIEIVKGDVEYRMKEYKKGHLEPIDLNVTQSLNNTPIGKDVDIAYRMLGLKQDHPNTVVAEEEDKKYGTADMSVPVSDVPCGGCGALLHCRDPSIPGFKPKEVFVGLGSHQLRSTVCQRCHFLKAHNIALQVRVNPETYLDMLRPIKNKNALVLLIVDLLDAPCSIHPRIMQVIGHNQPVVVVGNKIDLLPMDGHNCLDRIKEALVSLVNKTCLSKANVRHTCLISAENGFGVEELITTMQTNWKSKGDIYIIGSTNCGKSTLFNTFLNSDMCKVQAANLVLRATTSPWPGTTLNMLKFPLMKPSGRRIFARQERLHEEQLSAMQQFNSDGKLTFNKSLATLKGTVKPTFTLNEYTETGRSDMFTHPTGAPRFIEETLGINEKKDTYVDGHWCYDTPGALQPDQFLSLLTHEELSDVVPQQTITPETYKIKAGRSLFIGGLVRIDVLYVHHTEPSSIGAIKYNCARLTTFRSENLPICVVPTVAASEFYRDNLGNEVLHVPRGSRDRLNQWPVLKPTDIVLKGNNTKNAIADIVLSSAGFASVTFAENSVCHMRIWTPGGRGAYVRQPPFLAYHVRLRGSSKPFSVKYGEHILFKADFAL